MTYYKQLIKKFIAFIKKALCAALTLSKKPDMIKPSKEYFHLKGAKAENIVQELAQKTFLIDWCYLNPRLPNGKELCDLLVVFDDIAIIWQIKDLKLGKKGAYKKSELDKNLRQLSGARRQLFDLETSVKLRNPRRSEEAFDAGNIKKIYLISVILGKGEEVFRFVDSIKNYTVHVFPKKFMEIILNELDTISDFVEYLKKKEELINTGKRISVVGGEEDLLGWYIIQGRSFEDFKKADNILIEEVWSHLKDRKDYKSKKKEDETSYGWDSIINRAHEGSEKYELVARELARPNRFQRRFLSKVFLEAHVLAHKDEKHDLFRRIMPSDGITYCFLFQDDPEPRNKRKSMLQAICWIARGKYQQNKKVLGIATEKKLRPTCSYDFFLLDLPEWTEENQKNIERLQRDTGIFVNPIIGYTHEDEYPEVN